MQRSRSFENLSDSDEKSQKMSTKRNVFDPIKSKSDTQTNFSVRQSDVGSSSDSSKSIEIPENFKCLSEKTDLANAQLILLGEYHIPRHDEDIVGFIDTHAKKDDIVLVESCPAGEKVNKYLYAINRAFAVEALTTDEHDQAEAKGEKEYNKAFWRWAKEGKVKPFKQDVVIYGWDNAEVLAECHRDKNDYIGIKEIKDLNTKAKQAILEREQSMLETINNMRNNSTAKRIFVIAGVKHFTETQIITPENLKEQEYIALTPKLDPTEEEMADFRRRRNEGIG